MTTPPGEIIEGAGGTLRRAIAPKANGRHVRAEDTASGKRRNLSYEEEEAFWGFATIEVLRLTGIRCEELLELTHHGITEYRLPTTGELVPLLQIAPSKTDTERLLLVSPELADVLSAIISRLRGPGGDVPLTVSYDVRERVWNPPMPLLFQRSIGSENRAFTPSAIRKLLINALAATGLTGAAGDPLMFSPHDFRRIFVTDAIMSGLPPHIAQVICGHKNIDTTIGYKAVYPAEAIEAHRAFIARRRATRPSEEYRTPTEEEWDAFLAHFEKRKVSVGTCARAFASPCVHEHVPLTEIVWDVLGSSRRQRIATVRPVEVLPRRGKSLRVAAGSAVISVDYGGPRGGMDGRARHHGPGRREAGGGQGRPGGGDRRRVDAVPAP
jgi:integrase